MGHSRTWAHFTFISIILVMHSLVHFNSNRKVNSLGNFGGHPSVTRCRQLFKIYVYQGALAYRGASALVHSVGTKALSELTFMGLNNNF